MKNFELLLRDSLRIALDGRRAIVANASVSEFCAVFLEATQPSQSLRNTIVSALGLQVSEFEALRSELTRVAALPGDSTWDADIASRNKRLAVLRALTWIETARENGSALAFPEMEDGSDSHLAVFKLLRALELLMRSLLREQHGGAEALESRLRELFPSGYKEAIRRGGGDPLTGMFLKDLIVFFVDPLEWQSIGKLFHTTAFLTLLQDKRATVASFLEDVRRVRNTVAHLKRLSVVHIELLNLYYEELVEPVKASFTAGQTAVDPANYESPSSEAVRDYMISVTAELSGGFRWTRRWAIASVAISMLLLLLSAPLLLPHIRLWIDPDLAYLDEFRRDASDLGSLATQACERAEPSALTVLSKQVGSSTAFSGTDAPALHQRLMQLIAHDPKRLLPCVSTLHSMGWDPNWIGGNTVGDLFGQATAATPAGYRSYLLKYENGLSSRTRVDPTQLHAPPLLLAVWQGDRALIRALMNADARASTKAEIDGVWLGSANPVPILDAQSEARRIGDAAIMEMFEE